MNIHHYQSKPGVRPLPHKVVMDFAGIGRHERHTCERCSDTCLRQPWMDNVVWLARLSEFLNKHSNRPLV